MSYQKLFSRQTHSKLPLVFSTFHMALKIVAGPGDSKSVYGRYICLMFPHVHGNRRELC